MTQSHGKVLFKQQKKHYKEKNTSNKVEKEERIFVRIYTSRLLWKLFDPAKDSLRQVAA